MTPFDTLFGDLADFQKYGSLLLAGQYFPRYPLPLYGLFVVLSLIPFPLAVALILLLSILALIALFQRQALLWLWYVPILECLAFGNIDILCLWLLRRASPVSLALLTLKPQLFLFAVPTILRNRNLWKPLIIWLVILWGVPTVLYPQWIGMFIGSGGDDRIADGTNASLWAVPLLAFAVLIAMVIFRRFNWYTAVSSFNPLLRAYDYTMLAGMSFWLLPASWGALVLMWSIAAAWPMALLGLVPLVMHLNIESGKYESAHYSEA